MGHQIIRQPDGLLAVFSNSVGGGLREGADPEAEGSWAEGSWILFDATEEELADYYAERAADEARQNVQRTIEAAVAGRPREAYHQFTMTFEEADKAAMTPLAEERKQAAWREWEEQNASEAGD